MFESSSVILVTSFLVGFVYYIPTISLSSSSNNEVGEMNGNVCTLLFTNIILSAPIGINLIINHLPSKNEKKIFYKYLLFFSLFLPTMILYFYGFSQNSFNTHLFNRLFFSCLSWHNLASSISIVLLIGSPPILPRSSTENPISSMPIIFLLLETSSLLLFSFSTMFMSVPIVFLCINRLLDTFCFVIVCSITIDWVRIRIHSWSDNSNMTANQLSILYYQLALCVMVSVRLLIDFAFTVELLQPNNISSSYVSSHLWLQLLLSCALIVIPWNSSQLETDQTKRLMDAKMSFIRYISHEIRTPLNTVFLGVSHVKDEIGAMHTSPVELTNAFYNIKMENIAETLNDINESCHIVLSILNELLTADKLEGGMLQVELENVDPRQIISDCIKPFTLLAKQKIIDLNFSVSEIPVLWWKDYSVCVDKHKFAQVVRNLISNALKFTPPEGSITVKISREKADSATRANDKVKSHFSIGRLFGWERKLNAVVPQRRNLSVQGPRPVSGKTNTNIDDMESGKISDNNMFKQCAESSDFSNDDSTAFNLHLEVIDTGAGISSENLRKLFGQYVQFNAAVLQKGQGSGLGLWISKGIVELHGGTIGARSEGEGRGTTFFVDIPLIPVVAASPNPSAIAALRRAFSNRLAMGEAAAIAGAREGSGCGIIAGSHKSRHSTPRSTINLTGEFATSMRHIVVRGAGGSVPRSAVSVRSGFSIARQDCMSGSTELRNGSVFGLRESKSKKSQRSNGDGRSMNSAKSAKSAKSAYSNSSSKIMDVLSKGTRAIYDTISDTLDSYGGAGSGKDGIDGTCTDATSPRSNTHTNNTAPVGDGRSGVACGGGDGHGLHFFVVDDSSMNRNLIRRVLQSRGHRVSEAADGKIFLRTMERERYRSVSMISENHSNQCRDLNHDFNEYEVSKNSEYVNDGTWAKDNFPYDVILIDDNMPFVKGPAAVQILRERGYDGVIVGLTGNTLTDDLNSFRSCGANEVLTKPLKLDQLHSIVVNIYGDQFASMSAMQSHVSAPSTILNAIS